jgi:hypothetical protein
MTFIQEFQTFMLYIISPDIWNYLEMIASIIVIYVCLQQRVYNHIYKSSTTSISKYIIKVGQFGLYMQMMMALLTLVDGYLNFHDGGAHTLLTLWVLSIGLVKMNVWLSGSFISPHHAD